MAQGPVHRLGLERGSGDTETLPEEPAVCLLAWSAPLLRAVPPAVTC